MTDNGSPADATSADQPAEHFPLRLRVHALARTLGLTSREVLGHLEELGVAARTAQSSISREQAHAVAERLAGGEAEQPTDTVPAAAETAAPGETPAEPVVETPAADKPAVDEPAVHGTTGSLFSALSVEEPAAVEAPVDSTAPLFLPPTAPVEPAPKARPERAAAEKSADDRPAESKPADDQPTAAAAESTDVQAAPDRDSTDQDSTDQDSTDQDSTDQDSTDQDSTDQESGSADDQDGNGEGGRPRRRRRGRRGRGRGRGDAGEQNENDTDDAAEPADGATTEDASAADSAETEAAESTPSKDGKDESAAETAEGETAAGESAEADADTDDGDDSGEETTPSSKRRRRRRRRRSGTDGTDESSPDDPPNTVVHEREPRAKRVRDEVQGISGSTRLEAKRQRRRDGRDAGRRRPPILSESEFLARREAVERVMVVRERIVDPAVAAADPHAPTEDYTQVAVLEDGVLVEHFVTTETSQSMVGNIYLGRVQNVLPGMEAAFVDIGRGRNGVLYAGEVNWEAAGLDGGSRKIEQALKPGDSVLVQVSKDPVGHKGARLTTQISLAGRYLVYVPGGTSTGISRKLPDTERKRLKQILAKIVPDEAGVIIRTASEGVSAEELGADVERLEAQWKSIEAESAKHIEKASGTTRALYEEPDLLVRVVRDLFNEDFSKLVVEGDKSWDLVSGYVGRVAPDLMERVERFEPASPTAADSFGVYRVDEQLAKALDRKVWLPSGGTLIIEHTEAMTVVDVNTGKFTGSGGNLEATVTRNNLEAAEEIVRQMRLRDIGGMIIVDFIDMVLESNRDLVLRRLTEALSRDRTRHQVSEVTSLGLVQMTRKRLGTGLLEAFSTTCSHCQGRGVIVHANPVEVRGGDDGSRGGDGGSKRSRRNKQQQQQQRKAEQPAAPEAKPHKPAAEHPLFKAMAHHEDENGAVDGAAGTESEAPVEAAAAQGSTDTGAADAGADAAAGDTTGGDRPARTRSRRRGRGQGAPNGQNGQDRQDGGPDTPETPSRETAAPASEAPEPVSAEAPAAQAPQTSRAPQASQEPAAPAAATTTRRRRAVRRAAAPTAPPEPIVVATEQAPVTTVAEQAAEPVVAVKRTPRRRSGQRAAGPPQE